VSSEIQGDSVELDAIRDGVSAASESGIPYAEALVGLADAMVEGDESALAVAGGRVREALGPEALVDAVAVASNFERMVRIADGTGIPLDPPIAALSEEVREELDLDRFTASAYTPAPGVWASGVGKVARALLAPVARIALAAQDRLRPTATRDAGGRMGPGGREDV
jgi:hypothetical protein